VSPGLISSKRAQLRFRHHHGARKLDLDTLKTSPSLTFTVMNMSSFSGAMATCVDSIWKFA
jgi:hypothetical protein